MNCSVLPFGREALGAVIAMDVSGGLVTVSAKLFEVMPFKLALILVLPTATAVATPVALIVAVAGTDETQTT